MRKFFFLIINLVFLFSACSNHNSSSSLDEDIPEGLNPYEVKLVGQFDEVTLDAERMHYVFLRNKNGKFYMTRGKQGTVIGEHPFTWSASAYEIELERTDVHATDDKSLRAKYMTLEYEWRGDTLCIETLTPTRFLRK